MTDTLAGGGGFLPKGSEDPNGSFLSVLLKKSSDEVPLKGSFSLKGSPPNGSRKKKKKKGTCQKTQDVRTFYWLVSTSVKKQKTKCLLRSQQKAKRRAGDLDWRLKSLRYVVNTAWKYCDSESPSHGGSIPLFFNYMERSEFYHFLSVTKKILEKYIMVLDTTLAHPPL